VRCALAHDSVDLRFRQRIHLLTIKVAQAQVFQFPSPLVSGYEPAKAALSVE
jgi:hypothetical protein